MRDLRKTVVYVAGPYSATTVHQVQINIRNAEALALECWVAGFTALCPHTNTGIGGGLIPEIEYIQGDIELMLRCDAVVLVDNHESSAGTQAEILTARDAKIPVFASLENMINHYTDGNQRTDSRKRPKIDS